MSLANTKEPLYFNQSGANRPSHEGVVDLYDRAIALVREAGFSEVLLRGDTDFALTANFDHWDDQDVEFAFGFDARAMLVAGATSIDDEMHHELVRRAEREVKTRPRGRPVNVKQAVVRRRGFKVLRTAGEDVCEFTYRPPGLHARLPGGRVAQGPVGRARRERALHEHRWFFYITNKREKTTSADEIVMEARISPGLHRHPLPDRDWRSPSALARPLLEPLACGVLSPPRGLVASSPPSGRVEPDTGSTLATPRWPC